MVSEWCNAREAVAVSVSPRNDQTESQTVHWSAAVRQCFRRAVLDTRPMRLSLLKRAKLLGSLKWRLLGHGSDQASLEAQKPLLLVKLSGREHLAAIVDAARSEAPAKEQRNRIDPLFHGVDGDLSGSDCEDAAAKLREVLKIDPNDVVAHSKLGNALGVRPGNGF